MPRVGKTRLSTALFLRELADISYEAAETLAGVATSAGLFALPADGHYYIVGFPPEADEDERDWLLAVHPAEFPIPDGALILGSGARVFGQVRREPGHWAEAMGVPSVSYVDRGPEPVGSEVQYVHRCERFSDGRLIPLNGREEAEYVLRKLVEELELA